MAAVDYSIDSDRKGSQLKLRNRNTGYKMAFFLQTEGRGLGSSNTAGMRAELERRSCQVGAFPDSSGPCKIGRRTHQSWLMCSLHQIECCALCLKGRERWSVNRMGENGVMLATGGNSQLCY